jgi:purine nucleosidase
MKNLFILLSFFLLTCQPKPSDPIQKTTVIFDTDANNELDDQHALAYLVFNQELFQIEGVTVNATRSGGNMDKQYEEAERVLKLCQADSILLLRGADSSFSSILPTIDSADFDGKPAVDFIINRARQSRSDKLVLIAVGKLTNVALAVAKDSTITSKIRLVWLGSNYPEPGEYNQDNDTAAMNYLLNTPIDFEMVTVRYGKPSGTDAVKITQEEVNKKMPGLGPKIKIPVIGRHGGSFYCFGDYSVDLFKHIDYHGTPPSRALFDMAAVAIVKNPDWAQHREIAAPLLVNNQWIEQPSNPRKIQIWENFNTPAILSDFFNSIPRNVESKN